MKRILLVVGVGGPPIDYILPRMEPYGELFAYVVPEINPFTRGWLERCCKQVHDHDPEQTGSHALTEAIIRMGRDLGADALITFDEFSVVPVANAAMALGLRGAGPHARLTRDKWQMRRAFRAGGVPSPAFRLVSDEQTLLAACDELGFPFLLKVTAGAGSISHTVIQDRERALTAWGLACAAMRQFGDGNRLHYVEEFRAPAFVAEHIINGTTESWYETPGYGDYLSVEGIVCAGRYHPVAITSRLPTVPPFTEVGNQTPCVLPDPLQQKIAAVAHQAVGALGLQFCGTHTEIKLMANQELAVIESAARFPGCTHILQIETVFGVDMVGMLMEVLLYGTCDRLPQQMLTGRGRVAAGTLALLQVDEAGVPWATTPHFTAEIDWNAMVSPGTVVKVDWAHTMAEGTRIPPYNPLLGSLNFFGLLYMEAETPETLLHDQYSIWRRLRGQLEQKGG